MMMNRQAYEKMVKENLEWLDTFPRTRDCIVKDSVDRLYPPKGEEYDKLVQQSAYGHLTGDYTHKPPAPPVVEPPEDYADLYAEACNALRLCVEAIDRHDEWCDNCAVAAGSTVDDPVPAFATEVLRKQDARVSANAKAKRDAAPPVASPPAEPQSTGAQPPTDDRLKVIANAIESCRADHYRFGDPDPAGFAEELLDEVRRLRAALTAAMEAERERAEGMREALNDVVEMVRSYASNLERDVDGYYGIMKRASAALSPSPAKQENTHSGT